MRKFTFIGAGSLEFTNELVRDLMTFPAFDDCELMLMDIDEKRLSYAKRGVEKIVAAGGHHATGCIQQPGQPVRCRLHRNAADELLQRLRTDS